MSKMIYGSIDLNKVEKSKIISKDKDGKVFENGAKYLNIVVWVNDQIDAFGNIASVQQSLSKEERDNGVKSVYIGNLKENVQTQQQNSNTQQNSVSNDTDDDDLGF
jgi:hypothetical protein